jgi:hypothetical protein
MNKFISQQIKLFTEFFTCINLFITIKSKVTEEYYITTAFGYRNNFLFCNKIFCRDIK